MDSVDFKDIKVLTSSLDLKSNVSKTLSEILIQLQSGAQMIATVVKKSISGETVLNTVHGKMVTDNKFDLVRGDIVNIKLTDVSDNINGEVVSINNQAIDQDNNIKMHLFNQLLPVQNEVAELLSLFPIDKQNLSFVPEEIKGVISYLNLSKTDKASILYDLLEDVETLRSKNTPVSLKVVSQGISHLKDSFIGIVSGNDKDGRQLIKTEFGIISTENTEMKVGQKLVLTITNLNNKPIANSFIQNIADFIDSIVDNMARIDEMLEAVKSISPHLNRRRQNHNEYDIGDSNETDTEDKAIKAEALINTIQNKAEQKLQLNNIIKLMNNDEIKKIINEYSEIKKLLQNEDDQAFDADWQTIFIPIYLNNNPQQQKVKTRRLTKNHLQFIIDIKFVENPMQIDGNVIFESNHNKKLKSFDMVLKSENELEVNLKSHITNIFNLNQNLNGLKGNIIFEIIK